MPDARLIAALDPFELWKILAPLKPNAYEFVPGKQKFGVREKGRNMVRYFRTVDELEDFVRTAQKNPARPAEAAAPAAHEVRAARPEADGRERRELASAREQIRRLEEINAELREKGKKVVADRDDWEQKAKELEKELARARAAPRPAQAQRGFGYKAQQDLANQKIKKAKIAFAKLCHPNNTRNRGIDASVRADIFKEFWEQLEKIEREK
ncbi:MAG TPA: hypothetical protein VEK12_17580 [Alphaproteobacteria bacterium]|nr:hypothetical protein [Alphaproteobacteria bacterium]